MAETQSTVQHLTFILGREVFALNIDSVREVLELTEVTKIPRTPPFMRGVINLRGHAVPVMDLRQKFGMRRAEDTVDTCIIIVEVRLDGETCILGGLVDSVREVLDLEEGQIEAAPRMGAAIDATYIKGMARIDDEFIIILDLSRVFSAEELALARGAETSAPLAEAKNTGIELSL
ncbi:MAG: chemotaxis protein CheW [Proteobacteria bacterium]|nr:chemotaxis protein CheW [Pseudomonadota bacterium]